MRVLSPRNLIPSNLPKGGKEAKYTRTSKFSALCHLKCGIVKRAQGLPLDFPRSESLLCTLLAVTWSKLLNPS